MKSFTKKIFLILLTTLLLSCPNPSEKSDINYNISKNSNINSTASIFNQFKGFRLFRDELSDPRTSAIVYEDFNDDTFMDVFISYGGDLENPGSYKMFYNDGNDNFTEHNEFSHLIGSVVPRKAITSDYNGDGKPDVFIASHGWDEPPFPGESPVLLLSSDEGFIQSEDMNDIIGFNHGCSSADIDADGDIDIFVANQDDHYFLINDGFGSFTKNIDRVSFIHGYTAELLDIDSDGYTDIIVGGHEYENRDCIIYWGNESGVYSVKESYILPKVQEYGVIGDIDVSDIDLDGDYDIILNRTRQEPFYQGYYVQILINNTDREYIDSTQNKIEENYSGNGNWFDWLRMYDINNDGYEDIIIDNKSWDLQWLNINGSFERTNSKDRE